MEFLVSVRALDAAQFWSGIRASHVRARPDPAAGFLDFPGEGKPANCAMPWARGEARANGAIAFSTRRRQAARRRSAENTWSRRANTSPSGNRSRHLRVARDWRIAVKWTARFPAPRRCPNATRVRPVRNSKVSRRATLRRATDPAQSSDSTAESRDD